MKLTIDQELALFYRFGPDGIPFDEDEEEKTAKKVRKLVSEDKRQFDIHYQYYLKRLLNGTKDTPEEPEV